MAAKLKKVKNMIKTVVFCITLAICLFFGIFSSRLKPEKQEIDIWPAAVISIGFSAAIELFSVSKKNY